MGSVNAAAVLTTELEEVDKSLPIMFEREDTFYSMIEKKNVKTVSAKSMRVPMQLRPGGYFGHFDSDGGDLGRGSGAGYTEATVGVAYFKHAIEWTKKAEWATDSSRKSIVQVFRKLIADAMPDFRRHVEALCMTGGDGVLGTITSVANDSTYDTYTLATDGFGAKLLRYGQKINVYDTTLATQRTSGGEVEIVNYDLAAKTVKVAQVASSAATDKIVIGGVSGASPTSLNGVPYHHSISTVGTWQGLTRSTTPEIISNGVNAGGSFALSHARLARNKMGDRIGMSAIPRVVAMMHPAQQQAYEEAGQKVSVINKDASAQGLNMYFSESMQLAGAPVKVSYMWDKTRIDFVNLDVWGRAEMKPAGFYEVDGRKIFEIRGASGGIATSQVFYLTAAFQLFATNPAATAFVYGLSVPNGY